MFDVDDTLLTADNIYIRRHYNGIITNLTSMQFSNENYKYSDAKYVFDDYKCKIKVENSIKKAVPIYDNLKLLAKCKDMGYDVGILTAGKLEDTIYKSLNYFIKLHLNKTGLLNRDIVYTVNDIKYDGQLGSSNLKLNILQKLSKNYDKVFFVDNDEKNIKLVEDNKIKNIKCIHYKQEQTIFI